MIYDTAEIRRAAGQVQAAAQLLESEAVRELILMLGKVPNSLQGRMAETLENDLDAFRSDLKAQYSGLMNISHELNSFAARIEALDNAASGLIKSK